jgi:hypothetical protein
MSRIDELVALAREYGRATGLDVSAVSWRVFGDTKKLSALMAGADIGIKREEKALRWLSANWPNGAKWPHSIERPLAAEAAR